MTGQVLSIMLACGCEVRALPKGQRHDLALAQPCASHRMLAFVAVEQLARHGRGAILQMVNVPAAVATTLGHAVPRP